MSSFDFRGLLLHGLLGFYGLQNVRQQGIRLGCAHGQAPRQGPRAFSLQCGELANNLQIPHRSPHERGKVPAFVAVTTFTAGTAVVAAVAASAAVDAANIGLPGEINGVGGLPSAPPRPRLQVLPLSPCAWRVAPEATPSSCCRGRTRCPSLLSSLRLGLTRPFARALSSCRLPFFGNRGQLLRGRGRGRGYLLWWAST